MDELPLKEMRTWCQSKISGFLLFSWFGVPRMKTVRWLWVRVESLVKDQLKYCLCVLYVALAESRGVRGVPHQPASRDSYPTISYSRLRNRIPNLATSQLL